MGAQSHQTLVSVQAFRAIAAVSVVAVHCEFLIRMLSGGEGRLVFLRLAMGVDLFFIISGFVMVFASQKTAPGSVSAANFYARRVIRVAPLYWAITPLTVWLEGKQPALSEILASYLFIPFRQASGAISPLLSIGWTLNFEMFFYALFAIGIWIGRPIAAATAAIIALTIIGNLFDHSLTILRFWSDPIMFEFVAGMLLGKAFVTGYRMPLWAGAIIVAIGVVLFVFPLSPNHIGALPHTRWRALSSGLPMLCIFGGALMADARFTLPALMTRAIVGMGDASYALYLVHIPVVLAAYHLWSSGVRPGAITNVEALAFGAFAVSILAAVLTHLIVEAPTANRLKRVLLPG